jgi:fumarylacetoacetase
MTASTNETHDPQLRSWIASANHPASDFTIQNLPLGVFKGRGATDGRRIGTRIGDEVLDVAACIDAGSLRLDEPIVRALHAPTLNELMSLGTAASSALRRELSRAFSEGSGIEKDRISQYLIAASEVEMLLPAEIGDYTDFYASIYHATNVGKMFRPDNPLLPNYKYVPIGYHGRASSIIVSRHARASSHRSDRTARRCGSILRSFAFA